MVEQAKAVQQRAYAPYSNFRVGAALEAMSGEVFVGCNVENASYGLAMCAERTALFKAVSEGAREFAAVAVTAGKAEDASPCGACRQALFEFSPDMWVIWQAGRGKVVKKRLRKLLDAGFVFPGRKK